MQHDQGYHIKFTEVEGNVTWSAPKGGWDWSEYVGIGIDWKNESDRIVQIVGQLEESPNSGSFMLYHFEKCLISISHSSLFLDAT